ncbi:hypothetical protein TIFTF001_029198 [Ficus carica]|uniref:Uncharacterized protein n=1 Tax=Ficus carica TaxID=3494 RepID=A0AA88DRD9_FICCA|nr:hypothetical protein TIFTF001_029198 [Ficus carica]
MFSYYRSKYRALLFVILTQNKLTGENFNDWKRNLLIVLNFEKHSFVLTQPQPPTPTIDAPDRDFVALERWDNSNLSAMCYIRAEVGTPIKEHMMTVIAYLSEAQANGAEIDAATQLVMVFQTLSKNFNLFLASYNLNRKEMSLTELMKELQAFENIFKGFGSKAEAIWLNLLRQLLIPKGRRKRGRTRGTSLR